MSDQAFEGAIAEQFESYYDEVRGHVREVLTRQFLTPHLTGKTALDIGGGAGRDTLWLASQGFDVHLIDPAEDMTAMARQAVAANRGAGRGNITVTCGDPMQMLYSRSEGYDVVLSHGVLMYLDDPQSHLDLLANQVKPNGVVSILTKGFHGALLRMALKGDYEGVDRLASTGYTTNNLGREVLAVSFDSMDALLAGSGLKAIGRYGVRVASDLDRRNIAEVPADKLISIIEAETEFGQESSTKGLGQMLQFICKLEGSEG